MVVGELRVLSASSSQNGGLRCFQRPVKVGYRDRHGQMPLRMVAVYARRSIKRASRSRSR